MSKRTSKSETLTATALKNLVHVSDASISRWVRKGIPHTRQPTGRGGAQMLLFRREDALVWIEANASTGAATAARAARKANRPEPIPTASELPNVDELDGEGLLECLARLKRTERDSFRLLQKLKKAGDVSGVRLVSERYVGECRALVQLEQAAINYHTRTGALVDAAEAQAVFARVITTQKNSALGVAASAVPMLMPHLKNPDDGQAVFAILDRLMRDALRSSALRRGAPEPGTAGTGQS